MVKLCDTEGPNTVYNLLDAKIEASELCFTLVGVATTEAVAWLIFCAGLLVVLVPLGIFAQQLAFSQAIPILRDAQTMEPPVLLLGSDKRYHLFLSHVWSTGQDQCAVIKRQLQLLLPGVVIFLDVDDLEGYVRATGVMLFFLSKNYFTSRNCLREVKATIDEQLPLVLVHEQQVEKGGGPLEMMRTECREEMRPYVFDERAPITWHRISHYQNLTLKLIATEMLRHGPKYNDDSLHNSASQFTRFIATAHRQRNSSMREELTPSERMSRKLSLVEWLGVQAAKAPAMQEQEAAAAVKVQAIHRGNSTRQMPLEALTPRNESSLVLPGEVNIAKLALPRPLVLWCSTGNPGAAAMAHELNDALAGDCDAIQVVERRPDVRVLEAQGKSVAMLLYLNKDTWAARPGKLERDVRATYSFAHGLGAGLVRMASNMRELRRMGSSLDERGAGAVSADKT